MSAPLMARSETESAAIDDIVSKMKETVKNPGLRDICADDKLIRKFGTCTCLHDKLCRGVAKAKR
jgi:hypothetical protein